MLHIYVAAQYSRKKEVVSMMEMLNKHPGLTCVSTWATRPQRTGLSMDVAMGYEAADDLDDLDTADVLIILSDVCEDYALPEPGYGGGKHVELGYALAEELDIIVIGRKENIFHELALVTVVDSLMEAIGVLWGIAECEE